MALAFMGFAGWARDERGQRAAGASAWRWGLPSCSAPRSAGPRPGCARIPTGWCERIDALLPQTQCGQCRYPGCRPYAEAVARGDADIDQCPPGGEDTVHALAALLGREPKPLDPAFGATKPRLVAVIDEARCIGCALCLPACPVDAIVGAQRFMHTVIEQQCTGCELCLPPCPVDCIELRPPSRQWRAAHAARGLGPTMAARSTFPPGLELEARKAAPCASPCAPGRYRRGSSSRWTRAAATRRSHCWRPVRGCESARPSAAPRAMRRSTCTRRSQAWCAASRPGRSPGPAGEGTCIVIENDGSDELEPGFAPIDWRVARAARTAGADPQCRHRRPGRCRLPGAAKLAAARERSATHLVLNGAECEPWICCDDALMRERAADVVLGAQVLLHACGATKCTIAVEDDKPEAIAAIAVALAAAADPRIGLATLRAIYPAGRRAPTARRGHRARGTARCVAARDRSRVPERRHGGGRSPAGAHRAADHAGASSR